MRLEEITPLVLTFNERENIARCLERLTWAKRVVVLDSFSDDGTIELARGFANVEVIQRPFDDFARQCDFGLERIETEWTFAIDADYICPKELPRELESLASDADGYSFAFRYLIHGRPLRATLYPPRTSLFRTKRAKFEQVGHAHFVRVGPEVRQARSKIDHDDRKPLSRWLDSQRKYITLEADRILNAPQGSLGWKDRIRARYFLAPILVGGYCLFGKGLILDGVPGLFYAWQRAYAELLLSLELIDRRLRADSSK